MAEKTRELRRLVLLVGCAVGAVALAETYTYDNAGRLTGIVYDDPDRTLIRLELDDAGNLVSQSRSTEFVFVDSFEESSP
ncbi:MAG: RHS repeat domain-containing protein [Pseudomonadota bacterium]